MDRISKQIQGPEEVQFGKHRISCLLFADNDVLLTSSYQNLQHVLGQFTAFSASVCLPATWILFHCRGEDDGHTGETHGGYYNKGGEDVFINQTREEMQSQQTQVTEETLTNTADKRIERKNENSCKQ